ncbi:hypothetical protein SAMN05421504_103649 [Amycolatopsis xylanica]|uniref:DUF3558 domain-containing protein n=1 Tax=Amycolatopsis xylanica TaxID=589385 RepID=A0A1H3E5Z8_9PSEU|nr:hypothetical protein [Amycolatopsis xylanica]SDX73354.1 hypothetical protein SAMN05421504_103649 [Amycolatopsis xylanica]
MHWGIGKVATVSGALVVLAGLGVGGYLLFVDEPAQGDTVATQAVVPDRYPALPLCPDIAKRTALPKLTESSDRPSGTADPESTTTVVSCAWSATGVASSSVTLYLTRSNVPGSGRGEASAKGAFEVNTKENAVAIDALAGATKAAWVSDPHYISRCAIRFYQGNASAQAIVTLPKGPDSADQEKCREQVKALAVATSEALG